MMSNQTGDTTAGTTTGSAALHGPLWGARAGDWSTLMEVTFLQQAARLGARVTGLDAAQRLLDIAAERTPEGRFLEGDIEQLPFDDHTFDVVTGFNSFQYAANRAHALAEAQRVARPGAPVVIAIWGNEKDCDAAPYIYTLVRHTPAPPSGAPGPFALSQPGALRALVEGAGLTVNEEIDVACLWVFPDQETAIRGLLSSGQAVRAINASGELAVSAAALEAIAPYRASDGSYTLRNKFRYLLASA
jgi:SAM-dependent methyltransferase